MRFSSINFTCTSCGAPLKFSPATGKLTCEFCQSSTEITAKQIQIQEYDLHRALVELEQNRPKEITKEISCKKCGSAFTLTPYSVSTNCPYCGTPNITEFVNSITPEAILPFVVTHKESKAIFKKWIGSLWFAPNALKTLVDTDKKMIGYYLPYWTYDADTTTTYRGQRGDIYYVTVQRRRIINGREQIVTVQEPRIRWSPAQGHVGRYFDDVTVEASETLSRKILNALGNWDTSRSKPFDEKYLSGFESEEYAIGLDNGFELAQAKMNAIIRGDIRRDIGGDRQQIDHLQTQYAHATFKNVLFPVWTTHFTFKGKEYYYAINGQNGEITGERPYSYTKIILLVGSIIALLLLVGYYGDHFDEGFGSSFNSYYKR
jgi:Zn finger protein HypA/HybF involved in hydrogenase expression